MLTRAVSRSASDRQHVKRCADERSLALGLARHVQQKVAFLAIGPALFEIRREPRDALHRKYLDAIESRLPDLRRELFRAMKIRRGEVVNIIRGVAVLSR